MKTFMFCLVGLLLFVAPVLGQTEFITFPLDGAVFQQNSVGNHTFTFGGQVKNTQPMYYRLEKKNNSGSWVDVSGQKDKNLNYHYTHGSGSAQRQLFYVSGVNLNVGWYRLTVYRKYNVLFFISKRVKKHSVEFGVGDVYFIAGQSNASGYGGSGYYIQNTRDTLKDNTVSTILNNSAASPMARVFDSKMDEQGGNDNYHLNATQKPLTYAIPYKAGFKVFENGNIADPIQRPEDRHPIDDLPRSGNRLDDRIGIYPNGYNSWYWAPLAHKIANPTGLGKYSGTPTLWFNVASPSTSLQDNGLDILNIWDINPGLNSGDRLPFLSRPFNQTLMGKFKQTLETYAGPFGAKGVLWHQGEADHEAIMDNNSYVSAIGYKNSLTAIINKSREYATGSSSNSSLNWFVAKATLYPKPASIANSSISSGISISTIPNNGSYKGEGGLTGKLYTSANLRSNQTSGLANVFEGPNTDDINSLDGNFQRSNHYFVHFSGNSLQKAADSWYNKLSQTTNSLSPTTPIRITKVIKNSPTSYSITVDNSIGSNEFVWMVDSYGLNNWYSQGTTNNITFNGVQPDYFLHGYAKKNGRWHAIVPFMVPGGSIEAKGLRLNTENLLIPASGQTSYIDVTSVDVDWEIQNSYPSWLTVDYDEDESQLKIITSPNNGNSTRIGYVELKEIGGSVIKTITVNQAGIGGGSGPTSLTTLSPTNSSSEWSGYGTTRFNGKSIDGNTMQVSGGQYNQGIGTHANSRVVYHLGGSYNTFTGLVGRDDEADNSWDGGKVVFSVKLDGSTVWTSAVHGNTTNAEPFNINVSGKNTLELIVDKHTDENYGDHANWMNVYLSGSGGGCSHAAPTAISATPVSYGGGNTTLSATCESNKTVQWSNSLGSGSPKTVYVSSTTTYTAKCVASGCSDSPQVSVTVHVPTSPPSGGCSAISNDLVMGTWAVTGHPLVAKQFHGQWWLVQRINNNPESFLVRGSEMLTRGDVNLSNSTYSNLVSCFAYTYSSYGGLQPPSSSSFPTPSGYT